MSNLLTVREFAIYWNCSKSTVHALIKKGCPSIKRPGLGRRILQKEADLWLLTPQARLPASPRVKGPKKA